MPISAIRHYMETLTRRQAETRMMQGEAASVPHMTEEAHSDWVKGIQQNFETEKKAQVVAPSKLSRLGIKAVVRKATPTLPSPK